MHIHTKPRFSTTALALGAALAVGLGAAALRPIVASAKADGRTYTFAFQKAMPQDVLRWMDSQGIAVQVNPADLPQRQLSFAFDGIERDELVKAFGSLIGLSAEKRGDVYSLMKGVGSDATNETLGSEGVCQSRGSGIIGGGWGLSDQERQQLEKELRQFKMFEPGQDFNFDPKIFVMPEGFEFGDMPMIEDFEFDFDFDHDFDFDFDMGQGREFFMMGPELAQDPKALVEEIMKVLEESGAFSGQKMTNEQKAALKERLTERLAKAHSIGGMFALPSGERIKVLEELEKSGRLHGLQGEQHAKAMAELEKHMQELQKGGKLQSEEHKKAMAELEKHLQELHKSGKGQAMDKARLEEMMKLHGDEYRKAMEKSHEAMQKAMEEMRKSGVHKLTPEQLEKMKAEGMRLNSDEFKKHMEEMRKHLGENMKVMQIKLENVKKFIASLTPAQRELADKQGFLRPEDLTKEQRELLGIGEEKGDVSVSFSVDGQKIVIKSGAKTAAKKTAVSA